MHSRRTQIGLHLVDDPQPAHLSRRDTSFDLHGRLIRSCLSFAYGFPLTNKLLKPFMLFLRPGGARLLLGKSRSIGDAE